MEITIDWIAVLLGTFASMLLGMVWYSPKMFGEQWMKANKLKQKDLEKDQTRAMTVAIVRAFFISFSLYHIIFVTAAFYSENSFLWNAMQVGAWVSIAIVALTILMHDVFEGRSKLATKINIGFEVVSIISAALVIGLLG